MKAIILAGGRSERFGAQKAFAQIKGQYFYQRIIDVLEATNMFNKIIISTNETLAPKFDYSDVVVDAPQFKDKGPLAGLCTVMKQYDDELFFVVSVDTPMISKKAISKLYQFMVAHLIEDKLDIAGFIADNYPIPTIAFYSPKTLQYIEQALNSDDYSFKNVYSRVDHAWLNVGDIDAPEYWFKNINYQQDLDSLEQVLNK